MCFIAFAPFSSVEAPAAEDVIPERSSSEIPIYAVADAWTVTDPCKRVVDAGLAQVREHPAGRIGVVVAAAFWVIDRVAAATMRLSL
jgi:hypothetical protein